MEMETLYKCVLCDSIALEYFDYDHNIARCQECGLLFDNPRPTLESIINYYSAQDKYDNWLFNEKARDDLWRRRLLKMRKYNSVGPIVDIGAGIGQFLFRSA